MLCTHNTTILCQVGLFRHKLTTISPSILNHFWWELYHIPLIVPIIKTICPQFPTKHEGMLDDPFPLIRAANAITDPHTGKQLEYRQLINHPDYELQRTWQRSSANEFGRLAQGVGGRIDGTETFKFLHYHEMPTNRRPTYAQFVCEIRPQKTEQECTRLTVGGNLIDYPDTVTT